MNILDNLDGYVDDPDSQPDISQEDCWTVISSFFHDKGLVRQQLDSFDEFVQNTMQEIVDENKNLVLQTVSGTQGGDGDKPVITHLECEYEFRFRSIFIYFDIKNIQFPLFPPFFFVCARACVETFLYSIWSSLPFQTHHDRS